MIYQILIDFTEKLFVLLVYIAAFGAFLFTLDDLIIDSIATLRRLRPRKIMQDELLQMQQLPQKHIAIMIANWHEAAVIGPMIRGNLRRLQYDSYCFFLGVYPNDTETWEEASRLEKQYPGKVVVVVNSSPGPTSKGQMLNEIARRILASENSLHPHFDLFLMQDSEDVLHPHSLTLLNHASEQADFTQIPVFSFAVPFHALVGGIYMDEFSEAHTKDLLVRQHLGAAIPSAGVGTLLSRKLMQAFMTQQGGEFLNPHTLTEDYHLGIMAKPLGFRSQFVCTQIEQSPGQYEFIATREYFPHKWMASVRQKSRWTLGIAYQGIQNIGWQGGLIDRYFLLRDRRAPFNSLLIVLSVAILTIISLFWLINAQLPDLIRNSPLLEFLIIANSLNMGLRLLQRMRFVRYVNGYRQSLLVPLRWLLANVINAMASIKAHRTFVESKKTGQRPAWIKTEHRLPEHFGNETEIPSA